MYKISVHNLQINVFRSHLQV